MAKSRIHATNRTLKLLCIDDSNHSEDLRLKNHVVVKSQISVNNSGCSRVTQNVQFKSHEEYKCTCHRLPRGGGGGGGL